MIIRKPNLEMLTSEGVPKDFADVRDYFNQALIDNSIPWIPRKTPITNDEIRKVWVPSSPINITYVAENNGRVVGVNVVFLEKPSTSYEHRELMQEGEMSGTVDPNSDYTPIMTGLIMATIEELKRRGKYAIAKTSGNRPFSEILQSLGYIPNNVVSEEYQRANISEKAEVYRFP